MDFDTWVLTINPRYQPSDDSALLRYLRACWKAATLAEREACAKVCEQLQDDARKNIDWFLSDFFAGSEGGMCAEAIRARNW